VELSPIQWAIRPFTKFFESTGRAPRAEYWWFFLLYLVVYIAAAIADMSLSLGSADFGVLSTIWLLACFLPQLMVSIRRLHDTGKSGWCLLAGIVPLVGIILLFFMAQPGEEGPNDYGPDPYGRDGLEEVFA
jgi:uncharacterized membrane protein YhaH (DUF805 family)